MAQKNHDFLQQLQQVFEKESILLDPADCWAYGYDNSRRQGQALAEAASGTQAWFTDVRCAGTSGNFPDAQLPDPGFLLVLDFQYESRQWTPASACSLVRDTLLGALNSGALSFLRRLLPVSFCLCASL